MKKFSIKDMTYDDQNHFYGRLWGFIALVVLSLYPVICGLLFDAWPDFTAILACFGTIAVFWLAGIVEVFTYVPMLGAVSGGYLGFVTGNLSNLKVPCALSCMDGANVKSGTPEGEVVSIISTAVSSIVTVIIIAIGVCLMIPFSAQLSDPALNPAFENVLPALFGSLGVVFISKNWKIALPPLVLMAVLFVAVTPFFPGLYGYASVLIPVSALLTMVYARALYKRGSFTGGVKPEIVTRKQKKVEAAAETNVQADEQAFETATDREDGEDDLTADPEELSEGDEAADDKPVGDAE